MTTKTLLCGCSFDGYGMQHCTNHPPAEYRPKVTKYLVAWPEGGIGAFEREDVLCCAVAENGAKDTAKIFTLTCTLPTIYDPISLEAVREIAWPKQEVRAA